MRTTGIAIAIAIVFAAAAPAAAQQPLAETPRQAVRALFPGSSGTDLDAVAGAVVTQIGSVPIGSSSGGFTFIRDPRTGALSLKTETFGPSFAERPITLGKAGAISFGTTFQRTSFDAFEGIDLRSGALRAELRMNGQLHTTLFSTTVDVRMATTSVQARLGVTDNLDIGVSVPFVRLSIGGTRMSPTLPDGRSTSVIRSIQTSGVGDILVGAKWAPLQGERGAMAVAFDVRVPTGDTDRLIGTGRWQPRLLFLGSTTSGRVSPHVNLSYQFGGEQARVNAPAGGIGELVSAGYGTEFGYTMGLEVKAHPTVTISTDLVGRSLRGAARFRMADTGLAPGQGGAARDAYDRLSLLGRPSVYSLNAEVGSLNRWLLAVGAKTTILRRGLVRFDVMGALNDEGLKPGITTVLGIEYTF